MPRNVIAGRPCPEAEAVELVVRPPGRVVVRPVESVARVPRAGRLGAHDLSSPVEEALRARCLPDAGHRVRDEASVAEPAVVAVLPERRCRGVRARRRLAGSDHVDRARAEIGYVFVPAEMSSRHAPAAVPTASTNPSAW